MAGFIYWVPSNQPSDGASLGRRLGISDDRVEWFVGDQITTPVPIDGLEGSGRLVMPIPIGGLPPDYAIRLGGQVWKTTDGVAAGMFPNQLLDPQHLRRRDHAHSGITVEDSHRRQWLIPVARSRDGEDAITIRRYQELAIDGTPSGECHIDGNWIDYWTVAGEVWDWLETERSAAQQPDDVPDEERVKPPSPAVLMSLVVKVLARQYRIGVHGHNLLAQMRIGILDDTTVRYLAHAVTDWSFMRDFGERPTEPAP